MKISWNELLKEILTQLKAQKRSFPKQRKEIVRVVTNSIFKQTTNPSRAQLTAVAQEMASTYVAFRDMLGDEIVGSGYDEILNRLYDKRDNMKRPTHAITKRKLVSEGDNCVMKKLRDSYGCVAWQPSIAENCNSLKENVDFIKHHFTRDTFETVLAEIKEKMKDTYCLQRQFINTGSTVEGMKTEFPFLFKSAFMMAHFNELIGIDDAFTLLATAFRNKGPQIMKFMENACQNQQTSRKCREMYRGAAIRCPSNSPCKHSFDCVSIF